ncbi:MAG TPA: TrmJ/YjtD family RNA methyltransferase [Thermoanaerobaculia bacterium]|nr:TrmJ/YjtD family RNA methyltransferase [Thermoanaerobaculia bacterium]
MQAEQAWAQDGAAEVAVVLVRPREEGNVGAAARAMANMGLTRLILVEPAAALGPTARAFAVGARSVLDGCSRAGSLREALAPFPRVVGTTSTRDRRQAVPLIGPQELPARLAADPPGTPVALVFGPEVGGLTNEELAHANLVVSVPCAPLQPTLNLAQAVLILAYELYQARLGAARAMGGPGVPSAGAPAAGAPAHGAEPPADSAEVDGLLDHAAAVLRRIGFERDSTFPGVLRDLRAAAARAGLTRREAAILRGICRRAEHALKPG